MTRTDSAAEVTTLFFGAVELRLAERVLRVEGQAVALGGRGFDLLQALVLKRGRVVTKDELFDEVWPGLVVEENNLQVQISGLRRVLGAGAITTVPGVGYRFTLAEGELQDRAALAPSPQPAPAVPSARVLVADDNRVNRLLLCRSLELMGHQVSAADNGRRALEMMRSGRFELLLLDLAMPELDGFGVLQARSADPALGEVAVIVTSALGGVAPVARCIEMGADDFLHKPVDPWLLKARVDSSLMRKQQRDQQNESLRRALPGGPSRPGALAEVTVLASRLFGLEALDLKPPQLVDGLNHWCTLVFDAVEAQGGEVAQFSGDGMLVLFEQASAAVKAGRDIAELMRLFNRERQLAGLATLGAGTGLASGAVVVGMAAGVRRAAYACIGSPVAQAERLAQACWRGQHGLLLDAATRDALAGEPATLAVPGADAEPAYTTR